MFYLLLSSQATSRSKGEQGFSMQRRERRNSQPLPGYLKEKYFPQRQPEAAGSLLLRIASEDDPRIGSATHVDATSTEAGNSSKSRTTVKGPLAPSTTSSERSGAVRLCSPTGQTKSNTAEGTPLYDPGFAPVAQNPDNQPDAHPVPDHTNTAERTPPHDLGCAPVAQNPDNQPDAQPVPDYKGKDSPGTSPMTDPAPMRKLRKSYSFNVVMAGNVNTGKSAFCYRIGYGEFHGAIENTVGLDFVTTEIRIRDEKATLKIWDTAGSERYRSFFTYALKKADGVLVMCAAGDDASLASLLTWKRLVEGFGPDQCPVVVIRNKVDLTPGESTESCEKLSKYLGKYDTKDVFDISCKDGTNVDKPLQRLCERMVAWEEQCLQAGLKEPFDSSSKVPLQPEKHDNQDSCTC